MSSPASPSDRRELRSTLTFVAVGLVAALLLSAAGMLGTYGMLWALSSEARKSREGSEAVRGAEPTISKVVDGDTIEVRVGGRTEKVRLLGIDTPETKDPRKPVQCFGEEASRHTAELLPEGTPVRLVRDVEERDRYDRLLAYVYRASDGLFVNLELARGGYADLLTYPPNVAHTAELSAAVAEARREQRGLWGACGGPGRPA